MLLTISTTHVPATDLGYLLHKNPAHPQSFDLSFGKAHVFYPEASADRCTAALLLDVDPVALVRDRRGPPGERFALEQYVNDRPYVASSFLSVAISQVLGSALAGRSKERPDVAAAPIPLEATLAVLPCRGGEAFLRRLFEPLGYAVTATRHPLDEQFPEWGEGPYFTVSLRATTRLRDLLTHLYVLVPVLDDDKHYWVGEDEVDKLLSHGQSWLATHPEREAIVARYLRHFRRLTRQALARLLEEDQQAADERDAEHGAEEAAAEDELILAEAAAGEAAPKVSLNEQRLAAVVAALKSSGARSVLDLGCGSGKLLTRLFDDKQFDRIAGMDVSHRALEIAAERLRLDRLPEQQRQRVTLLHGSLTYRDKRLTGFDAAAVVEVIEHLDPPRLAPFARVLFGSARPGLVVLTTPNAEYNVKFDTLPAGSMRHRDHRFEWTRQQFRRWAESAAGRFGYGVGFRPVGPEDPGLGPPTQMALFRRG